MLVGFYYFMEWERDNSTFTVTSAQFGFTQMLLMLVWAGSLETGGFIVHGIDHEKKNINIK